MKVKMEAGQLHSMIDAAESFRSEALFNIRDNGILMRVQEPSGNALFAGFIPEDAPEEYETGEWPKIGVNLEDLKDFLPTGNKIATVQVVESAGKQYKLQINTGGREVKLPLINPDSVAGVPEQVPDLEHGININNSFDFVQDFVKDYGKMREDSKSGAYHISAREGYLYLWGMYDDYELLETVPWEDLDDYDIDWDSCNVDKESPVRPSEDHATDAIISVAYTKMMSIDSDTDSVKISIDNHYPMKVVEELENGSKKSWMIPPRIPTDGTHLTLPDRVIKDRGL